VEHSPRVVCPQEFPDDEVFHVEHFVDLHLGVRAWGALTPSRKVKSSAISHLGLPSPRS
jgi:hypothetical protein